MSKQEQEQDRPVRIMTSGEYGNLVSRPATARDLARIAAEKAEADRRDARIDALRAEYAQIRREALSLGARGDMSDIPGCPQWRSLLTADQFDAACVAHAMRALFAVCTYHWGTQQGRPRRPSEYVAAAQYLLTIAREDAEADRAAHSR